MDKYTYKELAEQKKEPSRCIINLDEPMNQGTHWVGLKTSPNGIIQYYDSFGVFPPFNIKKRIIQYNIEKDQKNNEENCGYRALLFCLII
jgi:hypothetical protein